MRRRLTQMAPDTTATHCGSCHHATAAATRRGDDCRADGWPGVPLEWDAAAVQSVRSGACHEAEMGPASIERVMGRPVADDDEEPPSTDPAPAPYQPASVVCAPRARESER